MDDQGKLSESDAPSPVDLSREIARRVDDSSVDVDVRQSESVGNAAHAVGDVSTWASVCEACSPVVVSLLAELILNEHDAPAAARLLASLAAALREDLAVVQQTGRDAAFVSYSRTDEDRVQDFVKHLKIGTTVFMDVDIPRDQLWPARLLYELLTASQIIVFWSKQSASSPWVAWEVQVARHLQKLRSGKTHFTNNIHPYIVVVRLDETPLSAQLRHIQAHTAFAPGNVDRLTLAGVVVAFTLLLWCVYQDRSSLAPVLLLAAGLVIAALQYANSAKRNTFRASLSRAAEWLRDASTGSLLGGAERVLDRIYGVRIVSWRALAMSLALTTATAAPALVAFVTLTDRRDGLVRFPGMEPLTSPEYGAMIVVFFATAMVLDFISLTSTRAIIRILRRRLSSVLLAFGLFIDLLVVCLCTVGPLVVMGLTKDQGIDDADIFAVVAEESGSKLGWVEAVLKSGAYLLSGQLRLARLFDTFEPTVFAAVALTLGSAVLPSAVHLAILMLAIPSHLYDHSPLRFMNRLLAGFVHDKRPPLVYGYAAITAIAVLVVASPSHADEYGEPATLVDPAPLVPRRLCWLRTELTQGEWRRVWDASPPQAELAQLLRNPSVFVGDDLPVESVSLCDALRFTNMWSLSIGRTPYYCLEEDCSSKMSGRWWLPGCNEGAPIGSRGNAGIRLPTPNEMRGRIARDALDRERWPDVGWLAHNSSFRTHSVGTYETKQAGPTLVDLVGNVEELTFPYRGGAATLGLGWFNSGLGRSDIGAIRAIGRSNTYRSGRTGFRVVIDADGEEKCPSLTVRIAVK